MVAPDLEITTFVPDIAVKSEGNGVITLLRSKELHDHVDKFRNAGLDDLSVFDSVSPELTNTWLQELGLSIRERSLFIQGLRDVARDEALEKKEDMLKGEYIQRVQASDTKYNYSAH